MVGAAATISILADRPQPSELMHVTTSGGIMRSPFAFAGRTVARDAGRAACVEHQQVKRPLESTALDEVGDQLGEALLVVLVHAGMVAEREGESQRRCD